MNDVKLNGLNQNSPDTSQTKIRDLFSLCSEPENHDRYGAEKNIPVKQKRPGVDVFQIQPHPFLEGLHFAAPVNLPEAREAGFHAQAAAMGGVFKLCDLVERKRARAHEA